MIRYVMVDVFSDRPFRGSVVVIFPDPVPEGSHAVLAGELGHETAFVTNASLGQDFGLKIFHQVDAHSEELPFAGVPTLAAASVLRDEGRARNDAVSFTTAAGPTVVSFEREHISFQRPASIGEALDELESVAVTLGLPAHEIGWSGRVEGTSVNLTPHLATAGLDQLMIPVRSIDALSAIRPTVAIAALARGGIYCFAPIGSGAIRARYFSAPGSGTEEHPGTGSAAAALAGYLGSYIGPFELVIQQGVEIGRASEIHVGWNSGVATVGGKVSRLGQGELIY